MAKVTNYKNSKFATFCSFLGYMAIALGAYCLFEDEFGIEVGIVLLASGFVLKLLAGFIAQKKSEKEARKNQNV